MDMPPIFTIIKKRKRLYIDVSSTKNLAGAEGLEPSARGFGDRCSTNWAIPLYGIVTNQSQQVNYIRTADICQ